VAAATQVVPLSARSRLYRSLGPERPSAMPW
jgi:hypothetical protein